MIKYMALCVYLFFVLLFCVTYCSMNQKFSSVAMRQNCTVSHYICFNHFICILLDLRLLCYRILYIYVTIYALTIPVCLKSLCSQRLYCGVCSLRVYTVNVWIKAKYLLIFAYDFHKQQLFETQFLYLF